eukprot:6480285-Amphidinium_carterae.1
MLGKRHRFLLPEGASFAKRLKANLDDLLASGQISGTRYCTLVNDAADAGLTECYSASAKSAHPTLEKHLKEMLRGSNWPKLRTFKVRMQARDAQVAEGHLAFLLPHELLDVLVALAPNGQDPLTDITGLDSTSTAHVMQASFSM